MIIIKCKDSPRYAYLTTDDESFAQSLVDIISAIRAEMNVINDKYQMLVRKFPHKQYAFPTHYYAITKNGRFEIGLLGVVVRKILSMFPNLSSKIKIDDSAKKVFKPTNLNDIQIVEEYSEKILHYYQKEALEKAKKFGRGIMEMGTGAGKTLTIAALCESYLRKNPRHKILITTPRRALALQFLMDFDDYGVSFKSTWLGEDDDFQYDKTASVFIITHSMLINRCVLPSKIKVEKRVDEPNDKPNNKKRKKVCLYPWIYGVDMLISDEVHTVSEDTEICDIIGKVHTYNKFGFTGTLSKEDTEVWNTLGIYGDVIYRKPGKSLREEDFLVGANVYGIRINHSRVGKMSYREECEYVISSDVRNDKIVKIVNIAKGNILVLCNYLKHGKTLFDRISSEYPGKKVFYISGETPDVERVEAIKYAEEHDNCVIVAISSIFSTGINIRNLSNIILTQGGKAYIRLVQTIGRGLRKHPNKTILYIFDIFDNLKYSSEHYEDRKEVYLEEKLKLKEVDV